MSRTHGHNGTRDLFLRNPLCYAGWAGSWGQHGRKFIRKRSHKLARLGAKSEIRNALREADSLEVALLSHKENVHAEVLHQDSRYCTCDACCAQYELDAENCAYADKCGDPYCEYCGYAPVCAHCGQYECEGACPESFETEDDWNERSMHMVHN